jgi:magnesium chelatase family protein
MTTIVNSASLRGLEPFLVEVEVTASRGVPKLIITGLADRAVSESKHRILTALKNLGIKLKSCRIVVNLAPADVKKRGAHLDLSIALAILTEFKHCRLLPAKTLVVGELGLNGEIRSVSGLLNYVLFAQKQGFNKVIIPRSQKVGLKLVSNIEILMADNLDQILNWTKDQVELPRFKAGSISSKKNLGKFDHFWTQLNNRPEIQRVLSICAAGGHHLLLLGPVDASKNSVARAIRAVLPPPSAQEAIEAMQIHSLLEVDCQSLIRDRPWRKVDVNITKAGLAGGGRKIKPGEISLAHQGVLFIRDVPHISYKVLSCLERPLITGRVKLRRNNISFVYPANFCLVASTPLCPCGYFGSNIQTCSCNPDQRKRFFTKIPSFLLNQIDLYLRLQPFRAKSLSELLSNKDQQDLTKLRQSIKVAREIQCRRYQDETFDFNYQLSSDYIQQQICLSQPAKKALDQAYQALRLSTAACLKTIKLARTIADLQQVEVIAADHINEALGYRFNLS